MLAFLEQSAVTTPPCTSYPDPVVTYVATGFGYSPPKSRIRTMNEASSQSKRRRAVRLLASAAGVYLLWLGWLVYVAWINTQAGNQ